MEFPRVSPGGLVQGYSQAPAHLPSLSPVLQVQEPSPQSSGEGLGIRVSAGPVPQAVTEIYLGNLHWNNDSQESHCMLQEVTGKGALGSGLNDSTTKENGLELRGQQNNTPSEVLSGGPGPECAVLNGRRGPKRRHGGHLN